MPDLTIEELNEIEVQVDFGVPSAQLANYPRDIALIHILRLCEDQGRLYLLEQSKDSLGEYLNGLKIAQDSVHVLLQWAFKYCKSPSPSPVLSTNANTYLEIGKIQYLAQEYSRIWDFFSLLRRNWASASCIDEKQIILTFKNIANPAAEAADNIINAPDDPEIFNDTRLLSLFEMNPTALLTACSVRKSGKGAIQYSIPTLMFERLYTEVNDTMSHLWLLEPNWSLGGYTLAQYRHFWACILVECLVRLRICTVSGLLGVEGGAINTVVQTKGVNRWIKNISAKSGLAFETVTSILSDLTYQPQLYQPGRKSPDVTCQPFVPLNGDLLALSNQLVSSSNAERNIWDLISVLRPECHSVLRNRKEQVWLSELIPFCSELQISTSNSRIPFPGGDIDLFLWDEQDAFALICQLKWLTPPDRISQLHSLCNELQKGIQQCQTSLNWAVNNKDVLANKMNLKRDFFKEMEFRSILMSKNSTGGGRVHNTEIPIISERLFSWIVGKPHRQPLRALYKCALAESYLPKYGVHFTEHDINCEFAGLKFTGKNFGMINTGKYDPHRDIHF